MSNTQHRLNHIYDIRKMRFQRQYQQACRESQLQQERIDKCLRQRHEYDKILSNSASLSSVSIVDKAYFDHIISTTLTKILSIDEQLVVEVKKYDQLQEKQCDAQKKLAKSTYKIEAISALFKQ